MSIVSIGLYSLGHHLIGEDMVYWGVVSMMFAWDKTKELSELLLGE